MTDLTGKLNELNSLTKYPSIPTYHQLDPRTGNLLSDRNVKFTGRVIGTEKIDGTNARIIVLPDNDGRYLIGSREELLHCSGDLIWNPLQGIVEALKPIADALPNTEIGCPLVLYLEVYGGKIGRNAKQYSTRGTVGWRLFDAAYFPDWEVQLSWDRQKISAWRDQGGQRFADETMLTMTAAKTGLKTTVRLFEAPATELPTSVEATARWLLDYGTSLDRLDDSGLANAEGVVLRTSTRSLIAKARIEDYARTLRRTKART